MRAYLLEGNDPNRTRDIPTPDEVRAMITGAGADGFQPSNRFSEGVGAAFRREGLVPPDAPAYDLEIVPDEEYPNMTHLERVGFVDGFDEEDDDRCATCGLINLCWCQPGCEHCSYPPVVPARQEVS